MPVRRGLRGEGRTICGFGVVILGAGLLAALGVGALLIRFCTCCSIETTHGGPTQSVFPDYVYNDVQTRPKVIAFVEKTTDFCNSLTNQQFSWFSKPKSRGSAAGSGRMGPGNGPGGAAGCGGGMGREERPDGAGDTRKMARWGRGMGRGEAPDGGRATGQRKPADCVGTGRRSRSAGGGQCGWMGKAGRARPAAGEWIAVGGGAPGGSRCSEAKSAKRPLATFPG